MTKAITGEQKGTDENGCRWNFNLSCRTEREKKENVRETSGMIVILSLAID